MPDQQRFLVAERKVSWWIGGTSIAAAWVAAATLARRAGVAHETACIGRADYLDAATSLRFLQNTRVVPRLGFEHPTTWTVPPSTFLSIAGSSWAT